MNPESLVDIEKMVVDALQRLVVSLQRLQQHGLRIEELPWNDDVRHGLEYMTPSSNVGSHVRRAQEDDSISGYKDGTVVLVVSLREDHSSTRAPSWSGSHLGCGLPR